MNASARKVTNVTSSPGLIQLAQFAKGRFIQLVVSSIAFSKIQFDDPCWFREMLGLVRRSDANVLYCRSPLSLISCASERVDNLGYTASRPGTGLLIPTVNGTDSKHLELHNV